MTDRNTGEYFQWESSVTINTQSKFSMSLDIVDEEQDRTYVQKILLSKQIVCVNTRFSVSGYPDRKPAYTNGIFLLQYTTVIRSSWSWEAERVLLRSAFNNLTEDNERLQKTIHSLTEEMQQKFTKVAGNIKVISNKMLG